MAARSRLLVKNPLNGLSYSLNSDLWDTCYSKRGDGRMDDAQRVCGDDYALRNHHHRSQEEMDGVLSEEQEHYAYGPGAVDLVVHSRGCKVPTDI